MKENTLFALIGTFDKKELLRFGKFVRSPFFTHRTDVERMFALLAKCRYRNSDFPDKEALFKHTFPDKAYDDLMLRATMSDLRELIESFLIWQQTQGDKLRASLALASEYRARNLPKLFRQTSADIEKKIAGAAFQNVDYHQYVLDFQVETARFQTRTARTKELPLQEISDAIDTLYLAQKLRHACTQLSHQAVFRTSYNFGLLPGLLDKVESGAYLETPAIALYYFCYRFLTEQYSLVFFQKFRDELQLYEHLFPAPEIKDLYLLAINFCIRKLNEGNEPYIREGWELYLGGLKRGILLEQGRLSAFTFNNIVAFGIKMKELGAVEQFIQNYQDKLEPAQRESFVHFNLARLEYTRHNYAAAMQLLQTADFTDLVNNLISKTLLLKIYYALDEYDLLESHLDSFRIFIRRRELSDYHRKNFSNIIALMRKIMRLPSNDRAGRSKLRTEIVKTEILTEREWLLEQLA
ncbi:MAG: hypothetical protein WCR52_09940 [Bacteroidota bacterium]